MLPKMLHNWLPIMSHDWSHSFPIRARSNISGPLSPFSQRKLCGERGKIMADSLPSIRGRQDSSVVEVRSLPADRAELRLLELFDNKQMRT